LTVVRGSIVGSEGVIAGFIRHLEPLPKPVSEQQLLLQADQVVPVAERAFRNV
jgi:hypothetical protein